jgi:hypothetical protein
VTIERATYDGPVTFCCDSCGEVEDTHCTDFGGALAKVRSRGWTARKDGDDWLHFCGDCK